MTVKKSVLVVGASRGLGLALAEEYCGRGWHVIATSRSKSAGLASLLERYPESLELETVDIVDLASVRTLRTRLEGRKLNTLFVNAGIAKANVLTTVQVEEKDFLDMMLTNALSPMRVIEVFRDIVAENGVMAAMSSEIGSITNSFGFWELYSSSKAALNMLMKAFSTRHPDDSRALLLVAPGWVRTEMGGPEATFEISESIPLVVDVVERNAGVPGLRYTDRFGEILPW
ncbi:MULTISPECIES: SDR family NAD(P)-dependent oxidoreductase [Paraburkholderia]|jgi:NAD(P)-dependent dehydrogenase (short-subunit alcohol dehydrogenase family)|uniref:NAD(P)-dependent dehydrogenase, short-chain alcohol dehydrogenase family n=1 Tax=Paraburkholderia phenazinium TaxID=60549 RepID=A0A1N6JD78_9BURK|nr:SDR family NAD(P)-dependent oxidoreductase [Paraburkholderia phenazinium]SIO42066.1 NAD(P)-dependent dehydrogenase, short-chain alcohol dehydrogenase family [Paraburkholderia phenazinium]SIO50002.1 NAD(P)-dependent dehydrogenase, short-chain alcohol dehydrogenase family [Paraburkholderia phenazinium]